MNIYLQQQIRCHIFKECLFIFAGYNLQCDLRELSRSYGDLEGFRYYEMVLDIQKLFKEASGGLSGLAEVFNLILIALHSFCN